MYLKAIISTLAAWFVGLLIDVNLGSGDWQILCLRGLLPEMCIRDSCGGGDPRKGSGKQIRQAGHYH